ncbi:MAG: SPASM domain-containing protein [Spirochaetes bacterium]|nr:SPASM domain-containing protein [Spirochaetota bacterium]
MDKENNSTEISDNTITQENKLNSLPIKNNCLQLAVALTSHCNLNCYMCSRRYNKSKNKHMSDEVFEKVLKIIPYAKTLSLRASGEPLMTRNLVNKLKQIKSVNPDIDINLTTNGIAFLRGYRYMYNVLKLIDNLFLSINGIRSYEKIMIPAKWKKIKKVLKMFHVIQHNLPAKFNSLLGIVVMRKNFRDIPNIIELARKYNFHQVSIKPMWIHDKSLLNESIYHDEKLYQKVLGKIKIAKLKAKKYHIKIHDLVSIKAKVNNRKNRIICREPWQSLVVKADGKALLCCTRNTLIGDLSSQTFEEIWYGKESDNYRKGMLTNKYYKECLKCNKIFPEIKDSYIKIKYDTGL